MYGNPVYSSGQSDRFLDIDTLKSFRNTLPDRYAFNGVFDARTTVWGALTAAAYVARARPYPRGTRLSVVRDEPKSFRKSVVTPDVIIAGSFRFDMRWQEAGGHDGYQVEYRDAETFVARTVTFPVSASRPRKSTIRGVTSEDLARELARYLYYQEQMRSDEVTWQMELDGRSFDTFDRVGVAFPLFDFSSGAYVVRSTGRLVELSQDVPDGPVYCVMRDPAGRATEVLRAVGNGERLMTLDADPPFQLVDPGAAAVATPVAFGELSDFLQDVTIDYAKPQGNRTNIKARLYVPELFAELES